MNTRHILTAALVFGTIGLGAALSPAAAAPVNITLNPMAMSDNLNVTKISGRHYRGQRQIRRHRAVRKHRRARRGYRNRAFGAYGVAAALNSTCSFYYRKAVTTGYRYWWVKFNHSCEQ